MSNYLWFLLVIHVAALCVIALLKFVLDPWVTRKWPGETNRKARGHFIMGLAVGYCIALVLGWIGRAAGPLIAPG